MSGIMDMIMKMATKGAVGIEKVTEAGMKEMVKAFDGVTKEITEVAESASSSASKPLALLMDKATPGSDSGGKSKEDAEQAKAKDDNSIMGMNM